MVKPVNKPDATLKLALVNGEVRLISFDTTVDFELELYDMDFHRSAYAREEVCYCLDIDDTQLNHHNHSRRSTDSQVPSDQGRASTRKLKSAVQKVSGSRSDNRRGSGTDSVTPEDSQPDLGGTT